MEWLDKTCEKIGWRLGRFVYVMTGAREIEKKGISSRPSGQSSETKMEDVPPKVPEPYPAEMETRIIPHSLEWREQLRIGTILETDDFAYIRVDEITPEGVCSRNPYSNRFLWTWTALKKADCIIYSQPESSEIGCNEIEYVPPDLPQVDIEDEIANELCRLCPKSWQAIHLDVQVMNPEIQNPQLSLAIVNAETGATGIHPTTILNDAATLLFQIMAYRQEQGWKSMRFSVKGPHLDKVNYNADFSYPSERTGFQPRCFERGKMLDRPKWSEDHQAGTMKVREALKELGKIVDIEDLKKNRLKGQSDG